MNAILSYQFDDVPVRVVLIAEDPWFVANDLAKVLGYRDAHNMARMLEDDERGTHIVSTLAGDVEYTIISESGMYAAVLKSRREEARRFRKWVTSEVLPSLRKTGRYQLHDHEPAPEIAADYDPPRLIASVGVVREARRLFGPQAARNIWVQLGLPVCIADASGAHQGDPMAPDLKDWLSTRHETTIEEAAHGIGLVGEIERSTRYRIGQLLRIFGWTVRKVKRGPNRTVNLWTPPLDWRDGLDGETADA